MKQKNYLFLFLGFLLWQCATQEDEKTCKFKENLPVIAYTHTPDYVNYRLDLIYPKGDIQASAITLNGTTGIRDVELFHKCDGKSYLILSDSRNTGGAIRIYDLDNLTTPLSSVPADGFSQEIEIFGDLVYFAVQNANEVRYFSLKNPASPGEVKSIAVGKKPTNLLKVGLALYVTNQDFIDNTDPSVSLISLWTNTVFKTVKVGKNPTALLWDGETLYSYNSPFSPGKSISYDVDKTEGGQTAPTVNLSHAQHGEKPEFGGSMARAGGKNYVLLSQGGWPPTFSRYELTKEGVSARDNSKTYLWIGNHPTTLYEAYKEGSVVKLTGGSLAKELTLVEEDDPQLHILEN